MWNVFWNIHMYTWVHPWDLDIQQIDYKIWLAMVLLSVLTTAKSISDRIPSSVQGIWSDTQQPRKGYRCSNTTGDKVKFPRPEKNVRRNGVEGMRKMSSCSRPMWAWAHLSTHSQFADWSHCDLLSAPGEGHAASHDLYQRTSNTPRGSERYL